MRASFAGSLRPSRLAAATLALAWLVVGPAPAGAQTKTGTAFGVFTLIEPDARLAAMGNAGAAAGEGLAGVFYNPGSVAGIEKHSFEFVHADWFAGIRYDWIGYAQPVGRIGTLYGTFTSLNSGEMPVRTVTQPLGTGEQFRVTDLQLPEKDGFAMSSPMRSIWLSGWIETFHASTSNRPPAAGSPTNRRKPSSVVSEPMDTIFRPVISAAV